jgi:hypothetical protein
VIIATFNPFTPTKMTINKNHMTKIVAGLFLFMSVVMSMPAPAAEPPIPPGVFNVRNFGAKGDGRTDDTAAIQAAVNAFTRDYSGRGLRVRKFGQSFGGIGTRAYSQVVFPPGTYLISSPIVFEMYASVRGFGQAIVQQNDPSKEIFYFHSTRQTHIQGMQFKGGSTQLKIWTNNIDASQIIIEHCSFADAGENAVECRSFTKQRLEGENWVNSKPWAPYTLTWNKDTPILTPNNADHLGYWNNSTQMTIANCRFINNIGAVSSDCDGFQMRNCIVNASAQADGPIFTFPFGGENHLYNIKAQANPAIGKHPYWIKDGGILSIRDSEFMTQSGDGIGFLRSFNEPMTTWEWFSVIIDNCRLTTAGCPDNAIVWLQKGIHPPIFSMTHVTETSAKPVNVFSWEDPSALANLKDFHTTAGGIAKLGDEYKIQFSSNSDNIILNLPDEMESFQAKPIPDNILQKTHVPRLAWNWDDLIHQTTSTLDAADYLPPERDPHADMTREIQKVLDMAGKKGKCLVILPGRIYEVSDTIRIPAEVVICGAGTAVFKQNTTNRIVFSIDDPLSVGFKNCQWVGGDRGVRIRTKVDAKARIAFENCRLYDSMVGIECLAGDGTMDNHNQTEVLFAVGQFGSTQGMVTNASRTQLDDIWISSDPRLDDQAAFENRGGAMRVEAMLGVPKLWVGSRYNNTPPEAKDKWPYSRQTRWYDNWGQFYVLDTRFGGESSGMCNVYNRSSDGTVYIEGGISTYYNGFTNRCILYLEQDPAAAVLRTISAGGSNVNGSSHIKRPDGKTEAANVYSSAVMGPSSP